MTLPLSVSPGTKCKTAKFADERSTAAKGNFIRDNGLLGFSMWELAADYDDILVGTITNAMKCLD
jgi:GH18 family chitinase